MATQIRKICHLALLLVIILSLSGFSSMQNNDEVTVTITQVDTSQFPQVTLYVSATDAAGEPVSINPAGVSIEENGKKITPDRIGGVGEVGPLTTMLVMDISGSMNTGGKLNAAKAAANAYIDQMRSGDLGGLISFNTKITYVRPVTDNFSALSMTVDGLRAQYDTAMYDALVEAVDELESSAGRKAIIILTDGLDNRSEYSADDVIARIGPAGLSISAIGLGDPNHGKGAQTALDETALTSLAERAGGVYSYAENENLSALYQLYGRTLQAEYQITYTSPSSLRDGVNRSLRISLDGAAGASTSVGQTKYNPGGLVPEISGAAPWSLFLGLLVVLLLLLLVPPTVRFALGRLSDPKKPKSRIKLSPEKPRPKIKLKE